MEGQCEGTQKKKTSSRTRIGCDVGCQTEQTSTASVSYVQQPNQSSQPSSNATSQQTAGGGSSNCPVDTTSSSASASGASTPANQAPPSSPAPSSNQTSQTPVDKKLAGPAGVKPNDIEAYFGEKQPTSGTAMNTQAPPGQTLSASQQSKSRAASTTGVVGEAKKQNSNANASSSNAATNGNAKADGPSWSDDNCKLRLVINRFSQLEETMCSPPKSIEGVSWKIMVMPKQHMVQKKQQKCMGFFLQCAPERAYSDQWSVHAIADMRMISYKPNVPHFARRTTHTYTSKENDWGYSCFMTWADIIDEGQGYIRDDTVVLEIAVKAEAPKNMMTHEDFLDKIEKWIVLADMQMKKGNIDLALEANQSAMKFCKGKDEECYTRLETQRETFVNAKLFESIERIEKGPVVCTDTTHGKPTSLRQALTGAQKSLNGKMTAKGGKKTRAVVTVQHMKKKKPYDQYSRSNPNQRTATGPTVKDLVEKRKSSNDAKKDSLKTKEELDGDDQTESDESPDEKAVNSDEEEEIEFDDEEYNEGDYCSQADECSTLELFESLQDIVEEENEDQEEDPNWEHDDDNDKDNADQGQNEDGIVTCDRMVQTDFEENGKNVVEDREMAINEENALFQRLLAETVLCKFQDQDVGKEEVETKTYYDQTGVSANPGDAVENVFGGDLAGGADAFSNDVLDSLPSSAAVPTPEEEPSQLQYTEKFLKSWLDLEGALSGNVDPEGVFARLSEVDRQDLLDELNFKINPLIVALDHEFRETVSCANNCLDSARSTLYHSQRMVFDCDKLRESFEERLTSHLKKDSSGVYKEQKRPVETTTKKTTSAAATSGSSAKSMTNGRPTVIAKRSMKQVVLDPDHSEETRGRADFLRNIENSGNVVQGDEQTHRMRDALEGFKDLNRKLQPMMATITSNNERFHKILSLVCSDNGAVADYIKKLKATHNSEQTDMSCELKQAREAIATAYEERKANEKKFQDNCTKTAEEVEKSTRALKEVKELQNKLKKSESKEKKEEARANLLQMQLNDLEEKSKVMRKELETLKKKSTEERAKVKKEKDRDSQTIRQQSIEITERENERDKSRKELQEALLQKEKFEKDKKAVAGQLVSMTERARTAEIVVMESKWNVASEELKKRREAIHHGFTETETLANRTRQVSDRDMMRKSLAEWKAALDKIDAQIKSVKNDYDHASDLIKTGVKTLSQTLDIKVPAADALPNLVKPPPVQVVAPSPSVIPAPIMPPTPAAGVIGQPRTPIGASRQGPSAAVESANAAATPPRSHVPRVPSPVGLKPSSRTEENPSSVWSWNTIGTIGNLGELREPSRSETNFNSSMDSLQRDIWAANGNTNGSLGHDFLMRPPSSSLSNGMVSGGAPTATPYLRSQSSQPQQSSVGMNQASYQQSQLQQHQHHQNSQRMQQQQQQPRGYGDMWNAQPMQQNSGNQDYGNPARMMANHNGGGDMSNNQGYSPWHNPPSQQQLRGPTPQQQSAGGHHNMFQSHFFENGM